MNKNLGGEYLIIPYSSLELDNKLNLATGTIQVEVTADYWTSLDV